MALQSTALAVLEEDRGSIPSTFVMAHNFLLLWFQESNALFWSLTAPGIHMILKHTYRQSTHTHKKKIFKKI